MQKIINFIQSLFKKRISRKNFIRIGISSLVGYLLLQSHSMRSVFAKQDAAPGRKKKGLKGAHDLILAQGANPYQNTVKAVEAMGGMSRFVKKNDIVVIKPNMAWDRTPEQGANTDPQVIAALVELCYAAGAKRVNVFDIPCNDDRRCYENSGIQKAAQSKGAQVNFVDHWNVVKAHFPYVSPMEGWPILRDAVKCDTFINAPVLKHHALTRLTLSMKNLMGVCSGKRGIMHIDLGKKIVDLTDYISPDLTVIDATRFLKRNGPSGGNIEDVDVLNKLIVATDPTLADTFACGLVKVNPQDVPYIREAMNRKFGNADVAHSDIHLVQT